MFRIVVAILFSSAFVELTKGRPKRLKKVFFLAYGICIFIIYLIITHNSIGWLVWWIQLLSGALQSQKFGDASQLNQTSYAESAYYTSGHAITEIAVWVYTGAADFVVPIVG